MNKQIVCHLCNSKVILKSETMKLNSNNVIIKDSYYYRCLKCKNEFSTSEQMKELELDIKNLYKYNLYI